MNVGTQHLSSHTRNKFTVPQQNPAYTPSNFRSLPPIKRSNVRGLKALAEVEARDKQNSNSSASSEASEASEESDYVVVGSGIGGACPIPSHGSRP